jgi:hypothetical protein
VYKIFQEIRPPVWGFDIGIVSVDEVVDGCTDHIQDKGEYTIL